MFVRAIPAICTVIPAHVERFCQSAKRTLHSANMAYPCKYNMVTEINYLMSSSNLLAGWLSTHSLDRSKAHTSPTRCSPLLHQMSPHITMRPGSPRIWVHVRIGSPGRTPEELQGLKKGDRVYERRVSELEIYRTVYSA